MVTPRQPRRHDRAAGDPRGPARVHLAARVDRQRVHAHLRRAAPDRRRARRPLRPPAAVRHRPALFTAASAAAALSPSANALDIARARAGRRRRDRDAAHADDPLGGRAAPSGAALALGVWGGIGGLAIAIGPLVGGAIVERRLVALDLLAQRADRARARAARARAAGRRRAGPTRRSTCRASRSPARACSGSSGGSSAATRTGWTSPGSSLPIVGGRRARRRVRRVGAARRVADAADALLPRPHVRADERRLAADVLRDVRLDLPARAVLPDGAGLLAARRRGCASCPWTAMPIFVAPIAGALSDRIGGQRADGRRARAPGGRARLDRRGDDAHHAVLEPRARRSCSRASGMALFFAPVANVVLALGAAGAGGQGIGRDERDPRARRRLRRGRARLRVRARRRLPDGADVRRTGRTSRYASAPAWSRSARSRPRSSSPRRGAPSSRSL